MMAKTPKEVLKKKQQSDTLVNSWIYCAVNNWLLHFIKLSVRLQNKLDNLFQQSILILSFYLFTLILVK